MPNKTRRVALIIDAGKPYDRRIIRGIAEYVQRSGYPWSVYVEADPAKKIPNFATWDGDGVIANFDDHLVARAVSKLKIPVVAIGGGFGYHDPHSGIPYVRSDSEAIAELVADHLLNLGFQRFAFCSEPANRVNGWAKLRADAFQRYLSQRGYACDLYTGRAVGERSWQAMQTRLQAWLSTLTPPVGLMACNDSRARHMLEACRALDLRVPEDVAIVGVDNDDIMCELATTPLTSVEQGTQRIGYESAAALDNLMRGSKSVPKTLTIHPQEIVVRQSTDVIAIDDPDVVAAVRYIRQHACGPINVQDVLDRSTVSRSTLEKRFRDVLGRSIHGEIRRVQLNTANRLLATTSIPIKEVAKRIGTDSVQYFTTLIREATGRTPGQIRREQLK